MITVEDLRTRCRDEIFETAFQRYFANIDPHERPCEVPLRGPLLFAIAESERARRFADVMAEGDAEAAGALMTVGHAGDRRVAHPVDDARLRRWEDADLPFSSIPGAYGASSSALDCIVDAARDGGAYGASLTGAGIAGVVLALCRKDISPAVAESLRELLASEEYCSVAGLSGRIPEARAHDGVAVNHAAAAACLVDEA